MAFSLYKLASLGLCVAAGWLVLWTEVQCKHKKKPRNARHMYADEVGMEHYEIYTPKNQFRVATLHEGDTLASSGHLKARGVDQTTMLEAHRTTASWITNSQVFNPSFDRMVEGYGCRELHTMHVIYKNEKARDLAHGQITGSIDKLLAELDSEEGKKMSYSEREKMRKSLQEDKKKDIHMYLAEKPQTCNAQSNFFLVHKLKKETLDGNPVILVDYTEVPGEHVLSGSFNISVVPAKGADHTKAFSDEEASDADAIYAEEDEDFFSDQDEDSIFIRKEPETDEERQKLNVEKYKEDPVVRKTDYDIDSEFPDGFDYAPHFEWSWNYDERSQTIIQPKMVFIQGPPLTLQCLECYLRVRIALHLKVYGLGIFITSYVGTITPSIIANFKWNLEAVIPRGEELTQEIPLMEMDMGKAMASSLFIGIGPTFTLDLVLTLKVPTMNERKNKPVVTDDEDDDGFTDNRFDMTVGFSYMQRQRTRFEGKMLSLNPTVTSRKPLNEKPMRTYYSTVPASRARAGSSLDVGIALRPYLGISLSILSFQVLSLGIAPKLGITLRLERNPSRCEIPFSIGLRTDMQVYFQAFVCGFQVADILIYEAEEIPLLPDNDDNTSDQMLCVLDNYQRDPIAKERLKAKEVFLKSTEKSTYTGLETSAALVRERLTEGFIEHAKTATASSEIVPPFVRSTDSVELFEELGAISKTSSRSVSMIRALEEQLFYVMEKNPVAVEYLAVTSAQNQQQ